MSETETVVLKNGAEEAKTIVNVLMKTLEDLVQQNPIAFYELVQLCKDSNHALFGNTGEILQQRALVQSDGRVHDSIQNVVLSAVQGEMLEMRLTNPVKE